MEQHLTEQLIKQWAPVLDHKNVAPITDPYKKAVTATILETTDRVLANDGMIFEGNVAGNSLAGNYSASNNTDSGSLSNFTPVLISLIRRAVPQLIAFDICGVQAMTMPTGLIFAMRSGYANTTSAFHQEALFNEANTSYSGTSTGKSNASIETIGTNALANFDKGLGIYTAVGEADNAWPQMGFTIEKTSVEVKTRRLRADYTLELAQDLKAVHNLDAEAELLNILSQEILGEINREVTRLIYTVAKPGGTANSGAVALKAVGNVSADINGRYFAEQWRGLQFLIERDAIAIAKDTRRGKGNYIIVDSETASALALAGILDYSTAVGSGSSLAKVPDETSSTFAGVLGGRLKVFIDPYVTLGQNFYTVGYKGASPYDAGLFYCPYVPLQMVRATDPNTFQPAIGFKTRYGLAAHPFSGDSYSPTRAGSAHQNKYFRISTIQGLA